MIKTAGASSSAPHEPHSLGSSLYRLFSRSGPEPAATRNENLANLAEIHNAVVDEVPVVAEDHHTTRSYLLNATRNTAAYTYESANQWLELTRDYWWWLQRRVIKEHDCQHPNPPKSDQMYGLLNTCKVPCLPLTLYTSEMGALTRPFSRYARNSVPVVMLLLSITVTVTL